MSVHWEGIEVGEHWYVGQIADDRQLLHTHPIPFTDRREADRAAARLNARPDRSIPRLDAWAPAPDLDPEQNFG